jgi:hypothetical protein
MEFVVVTELLPILEADSAFEAFLRSVGLTRSAIDDDDIRIDHVHAEEGHRRRYRLRSSLIGCCRE